VPQFIETLREHGVALTLIDQSWMLRPAQYFDKLDPITADVGSGFDNVIASRMDATIVSKWLLQSTRPLLGAVRDSGVRNLARPRQNHPSD
jgi:hypothetical protein